MEKNILVMTAVQIEADAVRRGFQNDPRFDIRIGGVGPAAAAASTARALATGDYELVITAGIGGGFTGLAEVGTLVVASEIVAADLGVETPEGFCRLDKLGLGTTRIKVDNRVLSYLTKALLRAGINYTVGPVLTASTVTGSAESAAEMAARVPGAAVEAMEGFGVALAANDAGLPVIEIRGISNQVGPRDRTGWRIQDALDVLEKACAALVEVLK